MKTKKRKSSPKKRDVGMLLEQLNAQVTKIHVDLRNRVGRLAADMDRITPLTMRLATIVETLSRMDLKRLTVIAQAFKSIDEAFYEQHQSDPPSDTGAR